ncbi:MAG: ATP-binding protein [Schleiferilactobacillus perolens]|uniref:ATP-binding protein n=1 Tax=Schleiferilactobacillus perolens TaxID=100468 RepID=UPI0039E73D2B
MEIEEFQDWLEKPEDDHHDFKRDWYIPNKREEMVKDIFSFVNTLHHDDCFLIIGVSDLTREVIGVEHDENRMNQQNLIDFIHGLPISGEYIPRVKIETVDWYGGHQVDVLRIFNTNEVPVFLSRNWNAKRNGNNKDEAVKMAEPYTKSTRDIYAKQVFTREEDVNTARDTTANYHQVEQLWKKHFRLDQPIIERYKYVLSDTNNWSYYENDEVGFVYNLDPDFYMVLVGDDQPTQKVMSFSINFIDLRMYWQTLKLKYRQITIKEMQTAALDGARLTFATPDVGSPENGGRPDFFYRYFEDGTLKSAVQQLLSVNGPSTPNWTEVATYYQNIVYFNSGVERRAIELELEEHLESLNKATEPSDKEIEDLSNQLSLRFPSDSTELTHLSLVGLVRESKAGSIVKKIVRQYRINRQWPEKLE